MNLVQISIAEEECKRFLKRCQAVRDREKKDKWAVSSGCKETGALRRAALDLKMELTNLNK